MVKTQFEKQTKRIRADNGGEFISGSMRDFYAKEGIILETTCRYTPQQNRVVERKHRHILDIARALKFEANVSIKSWGERVLTAKYIINRLPSKRRQVCNVVPFSDNIERNNSEARLDDFLGNTIEESDELTRREADQGLLSEPKLDPGTRDENETTIDLNLSEDPTDPITEDTTYQMQPTEEHRDKRSRSRPKYQDDFIVDLPSSVDHASPTANQQLSTVHPILNFLSYDQFSDPQKGFLTSVSSNHGPKHFNQVVQDVKWREAMQKEINALEENGTWSLEELPKGKCVINSRWVYKIQ
ncbi:uncharacterized protein LOC111890583 [Lactuca sativa]|nr:uncharacterized protein LOC111890583 [Lactuca sativa]